MTCRAGRAPARPRTRASGRGWRDGLLTGCERSGSAGKVDAPQVRRARRAHGRYCSMSLPRPRPHSAHHAHRQYRARARRARRARHGYLAPHVLYCAHIAISVGVTEAGGKAGAP